MKKQAKTCLLRPAVLGSERSTQVTYEGFDPSPVVQSSNGTPYAAEAAASAHNATGQALQRRALVFRRQRTRRLLLRPRHDPPARERGIAESRHLLPRRQHCSPAQGLGLSPELHCRSSRVRPRDPWPTARCLHASFAPALLTGGAGSGVPHFSVALEGIKANDAQGTHPPCTRSVFAGRQVTGDALASRAALLCGC